MSDLGCAVAAMLAAGPAVALTARGGPTSPQTPVWTGTTTFGASVHTLEVVVTLEASLGGEPGTWSAVPTGAEAAK